MKKMGLQDKPKIQLTVDQAEEVVKHEMMWHLTHYEDTPDKVLKAMRRVLKYYTNDTDYKAFKHLLKKDWREIAQ